MSVVDELVRWVQRKPLILIRFDEEYSQSLNDSYQHSEQITLAKRHSVFQSITLPTICLLEVQNYKAKSHCYLATALRQTAVSTFESRLTIKKLRTVSPNSLQDMKTLISDTRMRNLLDERLPNKGDLAYLSKA